MPQLTRVIRDASVIGGNPCIGMHGIVARVLGLVACRANAGGDSLRGASLLEAEDNH
jgi:hypothetical protein